MSGESATFERRLAYVLIDSKNFVALHVRWFLGSVIGTVGAGGWYVVEAAAIGRWPGGASRTGWVFGLLAGAIILFEWALWLRKTTWFRTSRFLGSAQLWMKAHLWLGLVTVPLVVMHTGFGLGGQFTAVLTATFAAVIASGVLGVILQNVVPRLLLERVPSEIVASQIDTVAAQYVEEATRIVELTCGETANGDHPAARDAAAEFAGREIRMIGARRRVGTILVRSPAGNVDFPRVAKAEALDHAFAQEIRPFLLTGRSSSGQLARRRSSEAFFGALRKRVAADARGAVDAVEQLCNRRRDLKLQWRLHAVLHGWLAVHLPLSMVLLLLLVVHVYYALRFG